MGYDHDIHTEECGCYTMYSSHDSFNYVRESKHTVCEHHRLQEALQRIDHLQKEVDSLRETKNQYYHMYCEAIKNNLNAHIDYIINMFPKRKTLRVDDLHGLKTT